MSFVAQDRRTLLAGLAAGIPVVMAGMGARAASAAPGARSTAVTVDGNEFQINGRPTCPGRSYRGNKIQGLLFTSRMVNCIINDQNPETRGMWAYRNGPWDPERNTSEFIAALQKAEIVRSAALAVIITHDRDGRRSAQRTLHDR